MNDESAEVKVMVVGETTMRLKSIFAYLESMDIKPLIAEAGKDAIDIYRREQPDFILMEDKLPDIGCFELSREIHALDTRNNWTSIIFLNNILEEDLAAAF